MSKEQGKLLKVTLEFENKTHVLEEGADEWLQVINGILGVHAIRTGGADLGEFVDNWKITDNE